MAEENEPTIAGAGALDPFGPTPLENWYADLHRRIPASDRAGPHAPTLRAAWRHTHRFCASCDQIEIGLTDDQGRVHRFNLDRHSVEAIIETLRDQLEAQAPAAGCHCNLCKVQSGSAPAVARGHFLQPLGQDWPQGEAIVPLTRDGAGQLASSPVAETARPALTRREEP